MFPIGTGTDFQLATCSRPL